MGGLGTTYYRFIPRSPHHTHPPSNEITISLIPKGSTTDKHPTLLIDNNEVFLII